MITFTTMKYIKEDKIKTITTSFLTEYTGRSFYHSIAYKRTWYFKKIGEPYIDSSYGGENVILIDGKIFNRPHITINMSEYEADIIIYGDEDIHIRELSLYLLECDDKYIPLEHLKEIAKGKAVKHA